MLPLNSVDPTYQSTDKDLSTIAVVERSGKGGFAKPE
jgi:hypothetical protein